MKIKRRESSPLAILEGFNTLHSDYSPYNPGFNKSTKSQAEMIEVLKGQGWIEEQKRRDVYRWREPKTKALYTLRDAFSLVSGVTRRMVK